MFLCEVTMVANVTVWISHLTNVSIWIHNVENVTEWTNNKVNLKSVCPNWLISYWIERPILKQFAYQSSQSITIWVNINVHTNAKVYSQWHYDNRSIGPSMRIANILRNLCRWWPPMWAIRQWLMEEYSAVQCVWGRGEDHHFIVRTTLSIIDRLVMACWGAQLHVPWLYCKRSETNFAENNYFNWRLLCHQLDQYVLTESHQSNQLDTMTPSLQEKRIEDKHRHFFQFH